MRYIDTPEGRRMLEGFEGAVRARLGLDARLEPIVDDWQLEEIRRRSDPEIVARVERLRDYADAQDLAW